MDELHREARRTLHHNAQRLLRPLRIINPYADQLTFIDHQTRNRRDHEAYLTLIDTVTYLHQYQRELVTREINNEPQSFLVATLEDIALANRLAHEILGQSIDELRPQTRKLLRLIDAFVSERCREANIARQAFRFTRRQLRKAINWGDTQLRVHFRRLEALEYLIVHRGAVGRRSLHELNYNSRATDGLSRLSGLVDVDQLKPPKAPSRSPRERV